MLVAALLLSGCLLPQDPEGTTRNVTGGELRVGLIRTGDEGSDMEALQRIAAVFDAELALEEGNPHRLIEALGTGELHLVAGGIPKDSPLARHAGVTRAFGTVQIGGEAKDRVLLLRKGENRFLVLINDALAGMKAAER